MHMCVYIYIYIYAYTYIEREREREREYDCHARDKLPLGAHDGERRALRGTSTIILQK